MVKYSKEFLKKSNKVHDDRYNYSKSIYKNTTTKIIIICPSHGEFNQTPHSHLKGHGCPECAKIKIGNSLKHTTESFIRSANKIHNNKYDYSNTTYLGRNQKTSIMCGNHGKFLQRTGDHLNEHGCPKCGKESMSKKKTQTTKSFINYYLY